MKKKIGKYYYKKSIVNKEEYLQIWERNNLDKDSYIGTIGSAIKSYNILKFYNLLKKFNLNNLVKLERLLEQTKK